jgi:hypothetical protein
MNRNRISSRGHQNVVVPHPALKNMDRLSKLMDSQFRIPGTDFRFGLDGVLGLIPGAGDLSTLAVSGYMISVMAKNGASSYVIARMVLNVMLDALLGAIPFIGDLFDFVFKANVMNMKLMREHYQEGRHRGGAWKVIIPVLILLVAVVGVIIYLGYRFLAHLLNLL